MISQMVSLPNAEKACLYVSVLVHTTTTRPARKISVFQDQYR
jgi:hypothetical protein